MQTKYILSRHYYNTMIDNNFKKSAPQKIKNFFYKFACRLDCSKFGYQSHDCVKNTKKFLKSVYETIPNTIDNEHKNVDKFYHKDIETIKSKPRKMRYSSRLMVSFDMFDNR